MARTLVRSAGISGPEEYVTFVGQALVADRFDLDGFRVLSELPAVERFAAAHPYALLPRGKAIRLLSIAQLPRMTTAYADDSDKTLRRIAAYVRLRYQEGKSVKDIAEAWGLDGGLAPSSSPTFAPGSSPPICSSLSIRAGTRLALALSTERGEVRRWASMTSATKSTRLPACWTNCRRST